MEQINNIINFFKNITQEQLIDVAIARNNMLSQIFFFFNRKYSDASTNVIIYKSLCAFAIPSNNTKGLSPYISTKIFLLVIL